METATTTPAGLAVVKTKTAALMATHIGKAHLILAVTVVILARLAAVVGMAVQAAQVVVARVARVALPSQARRSP